MNHPAQDSLARQYREFLDWPELCARLAAQADSSRGRTACQGLPLCESAAEARGRMAEVSELQTLLRLGESLPGLGFPEIEAH
jgi:dsDNA-specific endonuclease/ATPase MutS2